MKLERYSKMKMNKLCSNLDQSNSNSGGFTDEEKATMRNNIGAGTANVHIILTDYSSPTMADAAFTELANAVKNNEEVLISVGLPNTAIYYKLSVVTAAEYRFESYTGNGLSTLTINATTKAKTFNTEAIGLPNVTRYAASWDSAWANMQQLDSNISNGSTLRRVTLATPIPLSANKRYLIMPVGITGNATQTKTAAYSINGSYALEMWLTDSSQMTNLGKTAVKLAKAEIANHHTKALGDYPPVGGTYQAAFNSFSSIIEPEVNLSLNTLRIINSGNISWGFDGKNPALLVFDCRIEAIDVMEIKWNS